MIVLGIDTSLRSSGYGVVKQQGKDLHLIDCGFIKNKASLNYSACLYRLSCAMDQLVYDFNIDEVALESPFFHKSAKTAIILGMAKGAIIASLAKHDMPIYEYAPKQAKKAIVGKGQASKAQVALMVGQILNCKMDNVKDDASDALALAICHLNQKNHFLKAKKSVLL